MIKFEIEQIEEESDVTVKARLEVNDGNLDLVVDGYYVFGIHPTRTGYRTGCVASDHLQVDDVGRIALED